jgi:hypothetical protein
MKYGRGKSSSVIVARKPVNKAEPKRLLWRSLKCGPEPTHALDSVPGILVLASIHRAAKLDCQYPRWEPRAGKPQVRVCAGGAR